MTSGFILVGRSSSHFTRVARIFAEELGVEYGFEIVRDLRDLAREKYAENPALRLPVLKADGEVWFGALNICRKLARASSRRLDVVWPEQLTRALTCNAQELTLQAMSSEVELIMSQGATVTDSVYVTKRRASLENSVRWLDAHVDGVLGELPARDVSYLEVTLFCLTRHLAFREVLSMTEFSRLEAFCKAFEQRTSAGRTPFVFDT